MPKVNPENLKWARETAGLTPEEAAHGIGLHGPSGIGRLLEIEEGRREPSRRQLVAMAKRYRRPLLALYLDRPPPPAERAHDFRTVPDPDSGSEALLDALIRDVRVRQALVRSALEDADEAEPVPLVNSVPPRSGGEELAHAMRTALDITLETYRAANNMDEAFRLLRESVERARVYVLLMGNLGHYSSNLSPRVFRGFSIADPIAPFIVINETDAKAAWSFTLLHELGHLMLGESGISGYGSTVEIERLCDEAASQFLLRRGELNEIRVEPGIAFETLVNQIGAFAALRKLSRAMVAYNLHRTHRVTTPLYQDLTARFDADRAAQPRRPTGGADYYVVRRHRLGGGLVRLVNRLVMSGILSSTKAARVLGVKPTAVSTLTSGGAA
jgi:Zn-dependent peptidase ImmA (M78 family)